MVCWQKFDLYMTVKDRQNTALNFKLIVGNGVRRKVSRRQGVLKVNVMRWIAVTVICHAVLAIGFTSEAGAQTKVALIDIGLVFKNHPTFAAELSQLKSQAEQFKGESQQLQQQLLQKAEGLSVYEKESEEYRDQEALLAKESATLEVEQRGKMRNLLSREAQLHFDTYIEISNIISEFCDEQGIQLVLRFNSEEMNMKDPRTIMQKVNGGVVYYSQTANITDSIVKRISQRQAMSGDNANR